MRPTNLTPGYLCLLVLVGLSASCFKDREPPNSHARVGQQSEALTTTLCYGASGVQALAPAPMVGLCPAHRNQSPAVGAQSSAKPSGWTNGVALGAVVRGSPIISSSGTIVSGSTARIVALNANGSVRWQLTPGMAAASSSAIGADGRVYMVTNESPAKVRQLNASNGSSFWSVTINGTSSAGPALSADGATLYVTTQTGRLYALNTSTGATRWSKTTGAIWTSPAIASDGTIYVGADDGLWAFLPDGTKAWGPVSFGTGALVRASPAVAADGTIYVGTDLGTLEAVNPNGTKLGTFTAAGMGAVRSSPAIANDGTIYFGTRDHKLYAVDPNRTLKWTFTTGGNVDSSPAIGADGTIYVGSDDFKLYAIRPNGTQLFNVATGNFVRGGVAIGRNGTVYVGSDDQKLWAFGPGTCGSTDTTCNGVDENCNGSVDEGYASQATTCGFGPCASTGATSCVNGAVQDSCAPGTPASSDATCDARDDDCNGVVDDGCGSSSAPSAAPVVKLTPESMAADGSTWADANGNGIVFTAGGGSNGPVVATQGDGRRSLYFNSWQYMQGSLGNTASWTGVTITAVFATFALPPLATVFGSGGAAGSPNATAGVRWAMGAGLDPARGLGWAGADGTTQLGGGAGYEPTPYAYYVVTWKRSRSGSGWTVRRDGRVLTSQRIADSSFPTGVFNAFIGAEKAADGSHFGSVVSMRELHVYPQELSDADTAALERGLAESYDIGWYADGPTATPDAVLGSDLVGWYDAFGLSGGNGAPVASWPNRAGNAALVATGTGQPLFATSGIHGHPSVLADGIDDFMLATLNPPMPVGSRPHVWAVLRTVTPRPAKMYVAINGQQGSGAQEGLGIRTDNGTYPNWLVVTRGGSGLITPTMASAANTVPHIVSAGLPANFLEYGLKVDGMSGVGASSDPGPTSVPISDIRLFGAENGGFANIHIGEVIVSRTTPTPEIDRAVHRYLAAKWRKAAPLCGDGSVDPGEQCDDGNSANGDGCSASCALEQACTSCQGGDGCCRAGCGASDSDCQGGACANTSSCVGGDGCCPTGCETSGDRDCCLDCEPPRCGDGKVNPGEQCDDGAPGNDDACTDNCQFGPLCLPSCGAPGAADGCGGIVPSTDTDGDGAIDCADGCPYDPTHTNANDGCNPPACQATLSALTPAFECVFSRGGATFAVFGVTNSSNCVVSAPLGADNQFLDGAATRDQPVSFQPGYQRAVVTPLTGPLRWKLGAITATATTSGPTCADYAETAPSPVNLSATMDHTGAPATNANSDLTTPVTFTIPDRLNVSYGNAANGTAVLTFRDGAGATVTCTYRGGSPVAQPDSDMDRALGMSYRFQSCSNGALANSTATGTHWELGVLGGDPRYLKTEVEAHLGTGCSGAIDPLIAPEQVVAMRQGFSWMNTSALAETDALGLPVMRYALIYIETRQQYSDLQSSGIYFSQYPIFASELEKLKDKCGSITPPSDTRGMFVYSIMPAATYNQLRSAAQAAIQSGQGAPPFPAVLLPQVPEPQFANPDGSLPLRFFKNGFQYFDLEDPQTGQGGGLWSSILDGLHGAWGAILPAISPVLPTKVTLRLKVTALNLDPQFATRVMTRAWGPQRGSELKLRHQKVDVLVAFNDLVIPPSEFDTTPGGVGGIFSGRLDEMGRVNIPISGAGTTTIQSFCIHQENEAAKIVNGSGTAEDVFCDFVHARSLLGTPLMHDIPELPTAEPFELAAVNERFNYMAQLTDSYDFARLPLGRTHIKKALVNMNPSGKLFGVFLRDHAFTPCLDFGSQFDIATLGTLLGEAAFEVLNPLLGTNGLGFLIGQFAESMSQDIFLPPEEDVKYSRLVVTHEYGHYLMCDIYEETSDAFDLNGISPLYWDYLEAGLNETGAEGTKVSMEAFADFFTSQVTSGANYVLLPHSVLTSGGSVCVASDCLEGNIRPTIPIGTAGAYSNRIARLLSTFHDAFDHKAATISAMQNGDAWQEFPWVIHMLMPSASEYEPDVDDKVELPAGAVVQWIHDTAEHGDGPLPEVHILKNLAATMTAHGVNWCDQCELFAMHDASFIPTGNPQDSFDACRVPGSELNLIVGDSPPRDRNCVPCSSPNWVDASGVCHPPCPTATGPDRATGTCVPCPVDAVVDIASFPSIECGSQAIGDIRIQPAGDICPNRFVLEITNVSSLLPVANEASQLKVLGYTDSLIPWTPDLGTPPTDLNAYCALSRMELSGTYEGTPAPLLGTFTAGHEGIGCPACPSLCSWRDIPIYTVPAALIAFGGTQSLRIEIDTQPLQSFPTALVVATEPCSPE